jgi:hypothetical protein
VAALASTMPVVGDADESAAGRRPPFTEAKRAAVTQVVAIAAGALASACGLLMWRIVGYTAVNLGTGVSFEPSSITNWSVLLSVAPAGAAAVVAVVALVLRWRASWLRYLEIGLWLLALAGSVYIARTCAPLIGLGLLGGPLVIGDGCAVARYRIRLPTGTYSINVVWAWGASAGDTVYVPENQTNEEDFDASSLMCVG